MCINLAKAIAERNDYVFLKNYIIFLMRTCSYCYVLLCNLLRKYNIFFICEEYTKIKHGNKECAYTIKGDSKQI